MLKVGCANPQAYYYEYWTNIAFPVSLNPFNLYIASNSAAPDTDYVNKNLGWYR